MARAACDGFSSAKCRPAAALMMLIYAWLGLPTLFPCTRPTGRLEQLCRKPSVTEPRWGEGLLQAAWGSSIHPKCFYQTLNRTHPCSQIAWLVWCTFSPAVMQQCRSDGVALFTVQPLGDENTAWNFTRPAGQTVFSISFCFLLSQRSLRVKQLEISQMLGSGSSVVFGSDQKLTQCLVLSKREFKDPLR